MRCSMHRGVHKTPELQYRLFHTAGTCRNRRLVVAGLPRGAARHRITVPLQPGRQHETHDLPAVLHNQPCVYESLRAAADCISTAANWWSIEYRYARWSAVTLCTARSIVHLLHSSLHPGASVDEPALYSQFGKLQCCGQELATREGAINWNAVRLAVALGEVAGPYIQNTWTEAFSSVQCLQGLRHTSETSRRTCADCVCR